MSSDQQRFSFERDNTSSLARRVPVLLGAMLVLSMIGGGTLKAATRITGSGHTLTKEFDFSGFAKVSAGSAFQVAITQGDQYRVSVTVDDNLMDHLDVKQSGGTLRLRLKPNVSVQNVTLKAEVTMPELTALDLSGATRTTVAGFSSEKPLDVEVSGASNLRGDLKCGDARFGLSGASKAELQGNARNLKLTVSGASTAQFERFGSKDTVVDASGASHATVNAGGKLEASASGASSVRYAGNPQSVQSHTSGASSVKAK